MSQFYGYSPRILPFKKDSSTGFSQNSTLKQVAVQNFINLVLCAPGERIMYAEFGVGLRNYLFEMNNASTRRKIKSAIISQTSKYLPYIKIKEITFQGSDEDRNLLKINIIFYLSSTDEVTGMAFILNTGKGSYNIVEYGGDDRAAGAEFGGSDLENYDPERYSKEEEQFDDNDFPSGLDDSAEFARRRDIRHQRRQAGRPPLHDRGEDY